MPSNRLLHAEQWEFVPPWPAGGHGHGLPACHRWPMLSNRPLHAKQWAFVPPWSARQTSWPVARPAARLACRPTGQPACRPVGRPAGQLAASQLAGKAGRCWLAGPRFLLRLGFGGELTLLALGGPPVYRLTLSRIKQATGRLYTASCCMQDSTHILQPVAPDKQGPGDLGWLAGNSHTFRHYLARPSCCRDPANPKMR